MTQNSSRLPPPGRASLHTRPARKAPPGIGKATSKIIAGLTKNTGALDPGLAANWEDIAGPQLAKLCRPVRLRRDGRTRVLEIAANHGAAATHLQFQLPLLREKVNAYLGRNTVSRIIISQHGRPATRGRGRQANTASSHKPHDTRTRYSTSGYAMQRRQTNTPITSKDEIPACSALPPPQNILPPYEKGNLKTALERMKALERARPPRT